MIAEPTRAAPLVKQGVGVGDLNGPSDGATVAGDVLFVWGWCLFTNSRVARVEVIVDGTSVGFARTYVDRADVAAHYQHPDAPAAGFEMLISFAERDRSANSLVMVEATSLDGQRWCSDSHRVSWVALSADSGHRAELLARRSSATLDTLTSSGTRVLVFTHQLDLGGGQLWLFELLRQITAVSELECMVVTVTDGPLRRRLEDLGIKVHVTARTRTDDVEAYEGRIHELALLIRASGAGTVLVNTLGEFPAVDAAARAAVPCLWAIHESYEPAIFRHVCWGPEMHQHAVSRFNESFRSARALIFEARQTADLFAHICSPQQRFVVDYGVDREAIDVYRASVDRTAVRSSLGFDDDSVVIVVVGTVEPRKAQAAAVAAFDELAIVHDRLRLVLVGDQPGPYSDCLREQLSRCAAGDRVMLVPVTQDVYRWYTVADILLSASDIESLPRSILEGMAFETPVVSTDAFGVVDLIDEAQTGWLTQCRDLKSLVGLLHLVLRMPADERRAVGARARSEALRRDVDGGYGRVLARVLADLLEDPSCDLTASFLRGELEELAS